MKQPQPKFRPGQTVKYFGEDLDLFGNTYQIETGTQYRPEYSPPGYYYDLTHHDLKRIHESLISSI